MEKKQTLLKLKKILSAAESTENKDELLRFAQDTLDEQLEPEDKVPDEEKIKMLVKLYTSYTSENEPLRAGDIVVWKEGMKNRRRPKTNEKVIVIEKLDKPLIDQENDSSTPYFREPLDIKLGILDDDFELLCFYFDSKRFKKLKH